MQKQLYRRLTTELQKRLPNSKVPQVNNLALLTQTLVFSPNCHLSSLALEAPLEGRRESLTNRIYRFLNNHRINRVQHYFPLVRRLLADWPDREVSLILDRTDIGQEKSILLLAAGFKHRAIPLTCECYHLAEQELIYNSSYCEKSSLIFHRANASCSMQILSFDLSKCNNSATIGIGDGNWVLNRTHFSIQAMNSGKLCKL